MGMETLDEIELYRKKTRLEDMAKTTKLLINMVCVSDSNKEAKHKEIIRK